MATKPKWPTVDEQLAAHKIKHGTALDQFVRDNQDFDLLDPSEAHDDVGLPLWLRIYWRKQHPDVQHSTVNPGEGYPDILFTIRDWMLTHPDLPRGGPPQAPHAGGHKKGGTP